MATNEQFTTFKLEPSSFTPQQVYKLGQTLESENKLAKAIACYRSVIKSQPDLAEVYFTLANLLLSQGKKEQALRVYRQGVNNNPRQVQYVFALASALAAQQKWVRASNNYQRAARIEPSAKIYYHWGVAQYQLKEYGEAKSHFEQAAQLKPSAAIYYYWGLTELQLQELGSAESLWQKAIDLQENHTPANYQLGKLWQNQRQWQKAISAYRKVIASAPDHAAALVNLGMIYRQLQQYSQAIACFRQGINCISPGSPLEESAFSGYERTLNEFPQATAGNYLQLGKLRRARGYFPQAIACFRQGINCISPGSPLEESAFFGYERTLNEFPQATAENYLQLGKLRRARGYFPQAVTAFIKSLQLDPYFKLTYNVLQYTLIAPEQYPQLTEVYRQIVAKHPKISIAWGNLGDALTQQDCLEEAIECYRKAGYQRAVQTNPPLAKLDWPAVKKHGPDFIIAGASKSGTSSIYYYLSRHPQVLLSHKKELDFYWQHYQRGVDWYLAHFPAITDRPDFLTGEASPNYLRFPQVAQRIKDTFPQTKIILLLRNPVDRAISWHYHKLNSGLTKLDLATAISTEIERLATLTETQVINTGYYNPDNIIGSLYFYQIKPWIEVLGREQFLILKSEDFYLDPSQVMDQVFKFLDLPSCPLDNYPKVNAGSYQEAEVNIRKTLQEYFAPYNQRLEEYLGMEFNWD